MYSVVVIDDEYFTRKSLIASPCWKEHGFEIVGEAECGQSGYELILEKKPNLAIVDINMPNMDGISMVQKLRMGDKNTVVVMLTGYNDFEHVQSSLRAEANDYLLKPIQDSELVECLAKISKRIKEIHKEELLSGEAVFYDKKDILIKEIVDYIKNNYSSTDLGIDTVCEALKYNYHYISKTFKDKTGESLGKYIFRYRMEKAKELIEQGEGYMHVVARKVGYEDEIYFMKCFKRHFGVTPTRYIKQNKETK